jgi:hypothetical protein
MWGSVGEGEVRGAALAAVAAVVAAGGGLSEGDLGVQVGVEK